MGDFVPASSMDLARVMTALESYRQHWATFRAMPFEPAFSGHVDDVRALDYLDYEQLEYPQSGLAAASLVWGNVMASQAGLIWKRASDGAMWLGGGDCGSALIWPYARMAEAQSRGVPQFGWHAALMIHVIKELIECTSLPVLTHIRLRQLQLALEVGSQAMEEYKRVESEKE